MATTNPLEQILDQTSMTMGQNVDPARPFAGKVAVITGAGRGIGRGIALELGKRGCNVVVNYGSSAKAAEGVIAELKAMGSDSIAMQADISRPEEVARLFDRVMEHYGHIEFVISNSGMEVWCPETDVTTELFDKVFNLNCRGQFFVAQQGLKYCSRGGRIFLTSSVAAALTGIHNHALYAGSKAAVEGFTRAFSVDCGERGITVNAIAPGGVKTDMYDENSWHYVPGGYKGMSMDIIDQGLANMCPLKRVGYPADIGKAVSMLCMPESEWINGMSSVRALVKSSVYKLGNCIIERDNKLTALPRPNHQAYRWLCYLDTHTNALGEMCISGRALGEGVWILLSDCHTGVDQGGVSQYMGRNNIETRYLAHFYTQYLLPMGILSESLFFDRVSNPDESYVYFLLTR